MSELFLNCGLQLTWADMYFTSGGTGFDQFVGSNTFDKYPTLKALREKVEALPAIKKWMEARPKTEF